MFCQQGRRGLVDKTTAQQPKVQQFETDRRQELGLRKFSVIIPRQFIEGFRTYITKASVVVSG